VHLCVNLLTRGRVFPAFPAVQLSVIPAFLSFQLSRRSSFPFVLAIRQLLLSPLIKEV
jgi:hypothetical protein